MKHIIIINGSGGNGKDTFINLCGEKANIMNVSSIDPARNSLKELVGVTQNKSEYKSEKIRLLLHNLKMLSVQFNNYPYKYILEKIDLFINNDDDVMFIHIREPEEIVKVISHISDIVKHNNTVIYNTVLFRGNISEKITSNYGDASVENFEYDIIINNDGNIDYLRELAYKFITELMDGKFIKE